jgi:hypothetical protein
MGTPDWLQDIFDEVDAENADLRWRERQRAQAKRQCDPADLIRKEYPRSQPAKVQQSAAMSPELEQRWHDYIDARINQRWNSQLRGFVTDAINQAVEVVAQEVGKAFNNSFDQTAKEFDKERAHFDKEIADLRAALAAARADANVLAGIARGEIKSLRGQINRKRSNGHPAT